MSLDVRFLAGPAVIESFELLFGGYRAQNGHLVGRKKTLRYLFVLKVGTNAFNINANLHIPCNSIKCHTTRMREIKIKQIWTEFRGQEWLAILIVMKTQMARVNGYVTTQNGSECSSCCDEALPVSLKGKTIRSV